MGVLIKLLLKQLLGFFPQIIYVLRLITSGLTSILAINKPLILTKKNNGIIIKPYIMTCQYKIKIKNDYYSQTM
jgi:hypothetical protein